MRKTDSKIHHKQPNEKYTKSLNRHFTKTNANIKTELTKHDLSHWSFGKC